MRRWYWTIILLFYFMICINCIRFESVMGMNERRRRRKKTQEIKIKYKLRTRIKRRDIYLLCACDVFMCHFHELLFRTFYLNRLTLDSKPIWNVPGGECGWIGLDYTKYSTSKCYGNTLLTVQRTIDWSRTIVVDDLFAVAFVQCIRFQLHFSFFSFYNKAK